MNIHELTKERCAFFCMLSLLYHKTRLTLRWSNVVSAYRYRQYIAYWFQASNVQRFPTGWLIRVHLEKHNGIFIETLDYSINNIECVYTRQAWSTHDTKFGSTVIVTWPWKKLTNIVILIICDEYPITAKWKSIVSEVDNWNVGRCTLQEHYNDTNRCYLPCPTVTTFTKFLIVCPRLVLSRLEPLHSCVKGPDPLLMVSSEDFMSE